MAANGVIHRCGAMCTVVLVCLSAAAAQGYEPRADSPAAEDEAPRIRLLSDHGRSAFTIDRAGRPLFVIYAHGTLSTELTVGDATNGEWHCNGTIEHHHPEGETHHFEMSFTAGSPGTLSLNETEFPIPATFTATNNPDDALRGPWFIITSYGRIVPSGRSFTRPTDDELDPEHQYSQAWYMDRDVWDAEVYRNTLEMDDLEGWVVSWDHQHCMQHSDSGREARLRIWADGRVVSWEGPHRPIVEHQISPEEVQTLVDDLVAMTDSPKIVDLATPATEAEPSEVFVVSPRGPTWNQFQEFVDVRQGDHEHMVHVLYPGMDDPLGSVPLGWEEMQQRLFDLIDRSGGQAAGGEDAPQ